ncbi:MAG: phosphatase PAP2 family protein [Chlorobi bacterium]|nr:phosphatase PAP2 family protein [Chlorobiota bacterium]
MIMHEQEKISQPEKHPLKPWRENSVFLLYLVLVIIAMVILGFYGKADTHLFINRWHSPFFDRFFIAVTELGNGWMVAAVLIPLLFIRYGYALLHAVNHLVITLIVQLLKHVIFPGVLRPSAFFRDDPSLYMIKDYPLHHYNSFPSGHAATAFGIFMLLVILARRPAFKMVWFLLAVITAWSRVYLSQHFLQDIVAGSFIGTGSTFLLFYLYQKWDPAILRGSILRKRELRR